MTAQHDPCELLYGAVAIAQFLGLRPKQVYWRIEAGHIPTFRMGSTICASRTALNEWTLRQARAAGGDGGQIPTE